MTRETMMEAVDDHFIDLRKRINVRLLEINSSVSHEQANVYTWLYGALGAVPSEVMFICESPSLSAVERDLRRGTEDGPTGIERQWWGGERNPAAKRFRQALFETNLKTTPPRSPGGWQCYITKVIKEANIAGQQNERGHSGRLAQARQWSDILKWELAQVGPRYVFAVGVASQTLIQALQSESLLPLFLAHRTCHYSDRGPGRTDAVVTLDIVNGIKRIISS